MGIYECSFWEKGKIHRCFIPADIDDHIARDDPRTRLMDAIEHDCCMEHISYLVEEFGIDVSSIEEIVFSKAIDHSSYNALWWMEQNLVGFSVKERLESGGDALVERLASSPNILRFMEAAVEQEDEKELSGIKDIRMVLQQSMDARQDDPISNVFLTTLLKSNNFRAWDGALSPLGLGFLYRLNYGTKQILAYANVPAEFHYVANRFLAFKILDEMELCLDNSLTPAEFKGPNAKSQILRYIRSCWDYWMIGIGSFAFCDYDFRGDTPLALVHVGKFAMKRDFDILSI